MTGSRIPNEIVDSIIRFMPYKKQATINKAYRKAVMNKCKKIIFKATINWITQYKDNMDTAHYYIPKSVYKKFYPIKWRQSFIETVLDLFAADNIRYNEVVDICDKEKSLVLRFNKVIDVLNDNELFHIGW